MLLILIILIFSPVDGVQKCSSQEECDSKWPQAECIRGRCRCPPNTLRKPSETRGWVCLSVVDAVSGQSGPPLTCPTPEGAGYQVIYRESGELAMCSTKKKGGCPPGYECIQGLSILGPLDGVCCPDRENSCSQPIFDHEDGNLARWGFDGQKCVLFKWNPERPSSANNFKTKLNCEYNCMNDFQYDILM
ncbi:unnamed protein product [Caenorhabditis auriculariae]|uniref:BPTI/Kunitz inhibitor domain-containing protein n=1 Tax=Caenorhabditis auriculariae TaxID=2777116 RepID=A0A8S1HN58_9PELO|nr:unnamed protein product [Caenorhabditis auriculariae]